MTSVYEGKVNINKFINKLPIGSCEICPALGEDAAVISLDKESKYILVHSDPITEASLEPGYLSVVVACNDINMKGGYCKWISTTILLPRLEDLDRVIDGIKEACNILKCSVIGGHTEVTSTVKSPIVVTTAFSTVNKYLSYRNVKEGDYIVQVSSIGIEGAWILATEFKELLINRGIKKEIIENIRKNYKYEIIDQIKAEKIWEYSKAMHDITDGGIWQSLYEISNALNRKLIVYKENIIIREEIREIVNRLGINPYLFISSGSFIVITDKPEAILNTIKESAIIGKVGEEREAEVFVSGEGKINEDDLHEELARFESSYNEWRQR
ncbi:MAG: AIR synthase related protein [Sulfolobaceae archaeon]|nr:AIR synthase related protein [Sulfolobaceae archaeon]